jgi:hypothetical protein
MPVEMTLLKNPTPTTQKKPELGETIPIEDLPH